MYKTKTINVSRGDTDVVVAMYKYTLAMVNFTDWNQVKAKGLHETLDELQSTLIEIGQYVFETYVLLPSEIKSLGERSSAQFIQAQQQQ